MRKRDRGGRGKRKKRAARAGAAAHNGGIHSRARSHTGAYSNAPRRAGLRGGFCRMPFQRAHIFANATGQKAAPTPTRGLRGGQGRRSAERHAATDGSARSPSARSVRPYAAPTPSSIRFLRMKRADTKRGGQLNEQMCALSRCDSDVNISVHTNVQMAICPLMGKRYG